MLRGADIYSSYKEFLANLVFYCMLYACREIIAHALIKSLASLV
jgi:hypothetical protein